MVEIRRSQRYIDHTPIGRGTETAAFSHTIERMLKDGEQIMSITQQPGRTVLKSYEADERSPAEGFDRRLRDQLATYYSAICEYYGVKFFPRQRFLRLPSTNPIRQKDPRFVLVQELIHTAQPSDIFNYQPGGVAQPVSADTSPHRGSYKQVPNHIKYILGPAACLEILAGQAPDAVMADPLYKELFSDPNLHHVPNQVDDTQKFYSALRHFVFQYQIY
ncbi:MAG: hypothetical protein HYV33_02850 [Candidatus Kerfeldbacteria bacterium]|nr:hypothetical protein [Candidatus Kerfeldbacteria bacterium]